MPDSQPIAVVTTGGTIDKVYFDDLSQYEVGETVIGDLLKTARVTQPFEIIAFSQKDSLHFSDADRAALVERVQGLDANRVVITHGTDTMTVTAEAMAGIAGQTIVLVGALAPARFKESDASFNLGMAFATAQAAAPGIYITMNGTVFNALEVVKDRSQNAFVPNG